MMGDLPRDSSEVQQRIALFGGSFDPPHRGHLAIARAAVDALSLDIVLFAPTGRQPLKPKGASAMFADRVAMVSLLCAAEPGFTVSMLDAPRTDGRPNYTVETLEAIRSRSPGARLFAIAGADSFLELPRWHQSQRLLEMAEWIVVSRPGFSLERLFDTQPLSVAKSQVHVLNGVQESVSATDLRKRLAAGEDCAALVSPHVMAYIREHRLYLA